MAEEELKTTNNESEQSTTKVAEEPTATKPSKRKKTKRTVATGQLHIYASFNNTIVTFTDPKGAVLATSSAGSCGFRGSKKSTSYAAQVAGDKAAQNAKQTYGLSKVDVFIKGVGQGRDAPIRALPNHHIAVESITDITGIPHGGVRPRKARRV